VDRSSNCTVMVFSGNTESQAVHVGNSDGLHWEQCKQCEQEPQAVLHYLFEQRSTP